MLISELEELEDILDTLVFEEEPTIFTEEVILEMFETIYHLIDSYLTENTSVITESDFFEINTRTLFTYQFVLNKRKK
jgi:hypothetical protein